MWFKRGDVVVYTGTDAFAGIPRRYTNELAEVIGYQDGYIFVVFLASKFQDIPWCKDRTGGGFYEKDFILATKLHKALL